MQTELMNAIVSALGTILVALIGYLAQKIANYLKEKGITEKLSNKQYLVRWVVEGIEQVYQNEDGPEKFKMAKQEAIKLLNSNGLEVTETELELLIEAMVKSMNDGFSSVTLETYEDEALSKMIDDFSKDDDNI